MRNLREDGIRLFKLLFHIFSKKEIEKTNLLKNYFATGDLKPLQEY